MRGENARRLMMQQLGGCRLDRVNWGNAAGRQPLLEDATTTRVRRQTGESCAERVEALQQQSTVQQP